MYVIAGATGNVGSVVADQLLAHGDRVRVIVRDAAKGKRFEKLGAEVAVGTLDDENFLESAFAGAAAGFVLIPPNFATSDYPGFQRTITDAVSGAVETSGIPSVVLLSSIGADQEAGLGPIVGLNTFERKLRESGTTLTALRPTSFMENVGMSLTPAKDQGIYPSFMPETLAMPMIATRDIGAEAASALLKPPTENEIVDVIGPAYSAIDVAKLLGELLGKKLQIVTIPPEGWVDTLIQAGVPPHFADLYAEMYTGFSKGLARPVGDRLVKGKTPLETVLAEMV